MTLSETIEKISRGEDVTDIGQLSRHAQQWLRNEVKHDRVLKFLSHKFPVPKTAYRRREQSDA